MIPRHSHCCTPGFQPFKEWGPLQSRRGQPSRKRWSKKKVERKGGLITEPSRLHVPHAPALGAATGPPCRRPRFPKSRSRQSVSRGSLNPRVPPSPAAHSAEPASKPSAHLPLPRPLQRLVRQPSRSARRRVHSALAAELGFWLGVPGCARGCAGAEPAGRQRATAEVPQRVWVPVATRYTDAWELRAPCASA